MRKHLLCKTCTFVVVYFVVFSVVIASGHTAKLANKRANGDSKSIVLEDIVMTFYALREKTLDERGTQGDVVKLLDLLTADASYEHPAVKVRMTKSQAREGLASSVFSHPLPTPTGPYQVGTTSAAIVDRSRADLADPKPGKFRELIMQFWYPSQKKEEGQDFAPYFPNSALVPVLIKEEYNSQPPAVIQTLAEIRTNAILNARVRKGGAKYPLLILSPGFGEPRSNYTALAQQLASIGYVVITVDHPYGGFSALPDGRVLSTTDDRRNENPDTFEILVKEWAGDASYIVNQLNSKASFGISPVKEVVKRINFNKIGMLGHSLGGAAALETCHIDTRFLACADLDGAPFGKVKETGANKPTLVLRSYPIYSDEDLAKRGRTREQWDAMGREVNAAWRSIIPKDSKIPIYVIHVAGAGHMSFSDAPFTMPDTISRFGGRIIDANICFRITSLYLADFFGSYLKSQPNSLLTSAIRPFPEAKLEQVSGGRR